MVRCSTWHFLSVDTCKSELLLFFLLLNNSYVILFLFFWAEGDLTSPSVQLPVMDQGEHVQVVDLMQYTPLGGIFYYDVFYLPPQAYQVSSWEIRQVSRNVIQCLFLLTLDPAAHPWSWFHTIRYWPQDYRCSPTPQSPTWVMIQHSVVPLLGCQWDCLTLLSSWKLPKWLAGMLQVGATLTHCEASHSIKHWKAKL